MTQPHEIDDTGPTTGLEGHLSDLRSRLDRARAQGPRHDLLVADLESAYEELQVADEEVRVQQEEIAELLEGRNLLRWQRERMMAALPVPTLTTDGHGIIRAANAAAAGLVEMRVAQLLGKPILTLFPLDERIAVRRLISLQSVEGQPFRHRTTVVRRDGSTVAVEITAAVLADGGPEVTWILADTSGPLAHDAAHQKLPAVLARLTALASVDVLQDLLGQAVELCHEALGPEVELTISVGPPHEPTALASTDRRAQELDGAQISRGQGPCFTAFETARTVHTPALRVDARWPQLAGDVPADIGAVLAVPLEISGRVVGVLTVYGIGAAPIADHVAPTELLAVTLAAVLHELEVKAELRDLASDMERALTSRAVIDQAKGIVMADRGCTADEAFDHLVQLSSARQLKLRDVARDLVARRGGVDGGPGQLG